MAAKKKQTKKSGAQAKGSSDDAVTVPKKGSANSNPRRVNVAVQRDPGMNALIAALCVVFSCVLAANYTTLEKFFSTLDVSSLLSGSSSSETCEDAPVSSLLRDVLPVADDMHNNRVLRILHGFHLEDTMRDTPWDNRPPSLVLFKSKACSAEVRPCISRPFIQVLIYPLRSQFIARP
jgi:hypothetical protein